MKANMRERERGTPVEKEMNRRVLLKFVHIVVEHSLSLSFTLSLSLSLSLYLSLSQYDQDIN